MDKKNFTSISLQEEMQRSYLEYAMSVIVGRALPDARDGLKPVQRRIIFAMYELGLTPDKPFRKCARVVGDVLGKYHPHGDQAVYDALVKQVQNFSTKYPTLDGHGNFGSVDNDPPAAMRYTETRLAPIAHKGFLEEIASETVSFSNNFDGSQKEPDVLPAQLPFLLLNGSTGIAVGMATNIPPHNLGEIVDGLVALVKNKDISDKKLSNIIKGPDFPTGGELIYSPAIEELYQTGKGSITIRGVIKTEEVNLGKGKHKKNAIIISELPYQINKAGWIEKLAELVNSGKIDGISDIRDESDRDGMRIVIELKKDSNSELVISNLYKKTTLQTNFGAIFLALIKGKPVQLNLKKYLNYFLEFREETIRKRTFYFLKNTLDKLEISEGLSKATKNIKKVIEIIEESENSTQARSKLVENFFLSEKQANSILDMPLKKLTTLERNQIDNSRYVPLNKISKNQKNFEIVDSFLSELAVLGFEYGYSLVEPNTLTIWEAQFGDFANGAQVVIDQFIASGERKWSRASGLVMLLPHGYEGQGPEHSSARLERFLQLCSNDNMQVMNCTTPANYFHALRRQMHRDFRKPLIIMTPKSLLRHKHCVSSLSDFSKKNTFHRVLWDHAIDPKVKGFIKLKKKEKIEKVILCSGKIYFDLLEAREKFKRDDLIFYRIEQLYPFPAKALAKELKPYAKKAKFYWCQEEPKNMGAWFSARDYIQWTLDNIKANNKKISYIGRSPDASPATGYAKRHISQQQEIIKKVFE